MKSLCRALARPGRQRWTQTSSLFTGILDISQDHASTSGRAFSSDRSTGQGKTYAAFILERLPVVMPEAPEWEVEYKQWIMQLKLERGHFRQLPEELTEKKSQAAAAARGDDAAKTFKPVPRTTAADSSGDRRTMKRRLDQRLFLLARSASGEWCFPATAHKPGETIRQTAERALHESVGRKAPVFFIGNAPIGHRLSPATSDAIFYMQAQVLRDPWAVTLQEGAGYTDYAWLTKEEVTEAVSSNAEAAALFAAMLPN